MTELDVADGVGVRFESLFRQTFYEICDRESMRHPEVSDPNLRTDWNGHGANFSDRTRQTQGVRAIFLAGSAE